MTLRRLPISALLIFAAAFAALVTTPALALQQKAGQRKTTPAKAVQYACPMHPEVTSRRRGRCPKCGMNLVVKNNAPAPETSQGDSAAGTEAKTTINVSTPLRIPDITVYDQNNRRLNFYTDLVKGKTVAINFIFTTCTTICPPLTATFRRVQQTLGERVGRDVELISISVDPATDVPERLKDFSAKFKAGPGWTFVTGSKPEIDRLLNALGGYVPDRNDHTPMVLIGNDAAGFWTRTYGLAPASQIAGIVTDAAGKSKAAQSENATTLKNDSPADASANYFPNLTLLTQDNKPVRFYEDLLKGKTVLINFLFTTCKGVCPPMTANLARVQKHLGERVGRDIVMISISVDPTTDTPAVLKKFADNFKAQPGWYFLTGEKKNVDWVLYKLGGYVEDKQQHTGVLIIGNEATGEWMKIMAMSNPEEIAKAATQLASKKVVPAP
ncbi:MAG TPA: SCO family protein [Pyrinomonadaceae bacterium]